MTLGSIRRVFDMCPRSVLPWSIRVQYVVQQLRIFLLLDYSLCFLIYDVVYFLKICLTIRFIKKYVIIIYFILTWFIINVILVRFKYFNVCKKNSVDINISDLPECWTWSCMFDWIRLWLVQIDTISNHIYHFGRVVKYVHLFSFVTNF